MSDQQMHNAPSAHGGDVFAAAAELGLDPGQVLDYSANINPLGFPEGVRRAVARALELAVNYPDPHSAELARRLAARHEADPGQVLVGNGSTELIYLAARALGARRGVVVTPAFSEYERALAAAGLPMDCHPASEAEGFVLRQPPRVGPGDIVYLANPASPSGALLEREDLLPLVERMAAAGAWVVLDETFADFCPGQSLAGEAARLERLVVLRSFTKFYGIPGLRLGYCLAAPAAAARLRAGAEPWSVSVLAQAAGLACLDDAAFARRTLEVVARERVFLTQGLVELGGVHAHPSQANYLLCRLERPGWSAARLRLALRPQGILVRDASNFRGLGPMHFRLAVRLRGQNERLLAAMAAALGQG